MSVQGELSDNDGNLINGVTEFEIKIYINNVVIWRTLYKASVLNGSFAIRLGDSSQGAQPMNPNTTTYTTADKLPPLAVILSESLLFGTTNTTSVDIGVSVKSNGKFEEVKRYGLGVSLFAVRAASLGDYTPSDFDKFIAYDPTGAIRSSDGTVVIDSSGAYVGPAIIR